MKKKIASYYYIFWPGSRMHIMALPEVVQCRIMHWLIFTEPLRSYCVWIVNQPLIEEFQQRDTSEGMHYCEDVNLRYKRVAGPLRGQLAPQRTVTLYTRDIDAAHGEPNRPWSIAQLNTTTVGDELRYCGHNNENATTAKRITNNANATTIIIITIISIMIIIIIIIIIIMIIIIKIIIIMIVIMLTLLIILILIILMMRILIILIVILI